MRQTRAALRLSERIRVEIVDYVTPWPEFAEKYGPTVDDQRRLLNCGPWGDVWLVAKSELRGGPEVQG